MTTTGTITSQGIGSGLDVGGIITKLMAVEQQPLKLLDTKEASYQAKLTAFGTLKGAFAAVQTAAEGLNSASLFNAMSATASNSNVLSASANTAATAGNYSLNVIAQAQGQTIASQSFGSMTTPIANANGKLKIELGAYTGGVFSPDAAKTPVSVSITLAGSTLNGIRDAINNANAGVTARIVDVGGGNYKLLISSNETGAKTSLRITALDTTDAPLSDTAGFDTGLTKFNFDPTAAAGSGNEYTTTLQAQDAHFTINNLDMYRTTNTFSDAITGVTMTLAGLGASTLTVAKDTSGVSGAMDAFVKAYNTAAEQVRQLSAYDQTTGKGAVLTGDSTARSLQAALGSILNFTTLTKSSSISSLTNLGVTFQRDGSLKFSAATLSSALSSDSTAVQQLVVSGYNNQKGIAARMVSTFKTIMDEKNGVFASSTDSINSTIKTIGDQRTTLQRRLAKIQENYQAQYAAMDSTVSSWNSTGSYLTQQLNALMGNSNSNSSK